MVTLPVAVAPSCRLWARGTAAARAPRPPPGRSRRSRAGSAPRAGSRPVPDEPAATERERHRQPVLVQPVEQAPQAVARADDPAACPGGRPDDPVEPGRDVVVVSDEDRRSAPPDTLRAGAKVRRRVDHRQRPGRNVAPAGQLDEALVGRDELGHVVPQQPARFEVAGAGRLTVLQVPVAMGRPALGEGGRPERPGRALADRPKRDRHRRRGRPSGGVGGEIDPCRIHSGHRRYAGGGAGLGCRGRLVDLCGRRGRSVRHSRRVGRLGCRGRGRLAALTATARLGRCRVGDRFPGRGRRRRRTAPTPRMAHRRLRSAAAPDRSAGARRDAPAGAGRRSPCRSPATRPVTSAAAPNIRRCIVAPLPSSPPPGVPGRAGPARGRLRPP